MATIREIAKECNVSIATVSNILNNKGKVSEETRKLVLETIERLNYIPNAAAKMLKHGNTKIIGIITEDLTVFNTPEIVDGIDQYLEEKGYTFILGNLRLYKKFGNKFYHNNNYRELINEEINVMKAKQVEGIIYVCAHSRDLSDIISEVDLPFVLVYGFTTNSKIPSVIFHDEKAANVIVKELLSKVDKIGVIAGEEDSIHTRDRLMGFQKALYDFKLLYNPELVVYSDWTREGGYKAAHKLLEHGIEGIFSMNDKMVAGVYDYANEKGIILGQDLKIVGIGSEISDVLHPSLTTMSLPLFEMGQNSAQIMIGLLSDKTDSVVLTNDSINRIECNLIIGESI